MNKMLNILSRNRIMNFDLFIDSVPFSYDIELIKVEDTSDLFGYEDPQSVMKINTKAIIMIKPSKSFLKEVGLFFEGELPILGFFKSSDGVKKRDIVKLSGLESADGNKNDYIFEVVDIISIGYNDAYVYKLVPIRQYDGV